MRGRTLSCQGPQPPRRAGGGRPGDCRGAWLAVVDLPTFGLDAASELGVPSNGSSPFVHLLPMTRSPAAEPARAPRRGSMSSLPSRRFRRPAGPSPADAPTSAAPLAARIGSEVAVVILLGSEVQVTVPCRAWLGDPGGSTGRTRLRHAPHGGQPHWSGLGSDGHGHPRESPGRGGRHGAAVFPGNGSAELCHRRVWPDVSMERPRNGSSRSGSPTGRSWPQASAPTSRRR